MRDGGRPTDVKAVLLTCHGGPEKLEYWEDVPTPDPVPGEVLVEVGAAGVNNTDLWTREGAYGAADDPEATGGWRRPRCVSCACAYATSAHSATESGAGLRTEEMRAGL